MKKGKFLLLFVFMFVLSIPRIYALTIRETMDDKDGFSTLEQGSIIIGATRFSPDTIVTAGKAATAGVNDVKLYMLQNDTIDGYENPGVYYYIDPDIGWFFLDDDNNASLVVDEEEKEELSNLDIYYVDNVEKVLEVELPDIKIDENSLPDGVILKDNKLLINATIPKFELETEDKNKVSFEIDSTTSSFVENVKTCYTVNDGVITNYNSDCGSSVVIPLEINDEKIVGIGPNAFKNTNLEEVVIPSDILSLGNNAFAENKLVSVIIKDKYDESDFSLYGENVFGEFDKILYDNEMTGALNHIDKELVIKYYKDFDFNMFINNNPSSGGVNSYIFSYIMNILKKNGYGEDYNYCEAGNYCEDDKNKDEDFYNVELNTEDNVNYQFILEKYDASKDKVYKYIREFKVSFKEAGTKEDNDKVIEAINNLQMDERYFDKHSDSHDIVTRIKYLEDLEDLYNIDIILTNADIGYGGYNKDDIIIMPTFRVIYYLKDGVIYQFSNYSIVYGFNNYYRHNINEEYDNLDDYVSVILDSFSTKSGVKNYEVIKNADGSLYKELDNPLYETGITYSINLIDRDFNEKWEIDFTKFYDDKYDSNGYTDAECFEFSDGVITNYDGTCGVNVKIPEKINNIEVTEIASCDYDKIRAFDNMALKSVILPNTLKRIGNSSFNFNNLVSITIPNSVEEIGDSAFSDNRLTSVVIPDSVKNLGGGAFSYNEIESIKIGGGLDKISQYLFTYNKIKNVEIPSNIKYIESSAFENNLIEELIIPDSVKKIDDMAFMSNKINSLILPDLLESIGNGAFTDNQLSNNDAFVYGRKFDEETNKYVWDKTIITSYAGINRDNVIIPNNVEIISEYAFYGLNLKEIEIPYGVKEIGDSAFYGNKLNKVTIPNTVLELGCYVFDGNEFDGENSFIYGRDENGNVDYSILYAYYSKKHELDELVISNTVKKIFANAFSSLYVNNLVIPYGVKEIGDSAFNYVYISNDVTLPKSVEKIGIDVFNTQYSLNKDKGYVYARNEDGTIDKSIIMAYRGYIDDGELTLPDGIVEIRENAFRSNYNLYHVILPSTLEKIGNNAFESTNIEELSIPSSVKMIGDSAFNYNYNLDKVLILGKKNENDFEKLGKDVFGNISQIIYELYEPEKIEVSEVKLNKNELTLNIGDVETLIATIEPSDATDKDVIWGSSNTDVITVEDGVVTALSKGNAMITASVGGKTVVCNVVVNDIYTYEFEMIEDSTADEYYLYIFNSKGEKVSGRVNVIYNNNKNKEHDVTVDGLKIVKSSVSSVEILSGN